MELLSAARLLSQAIIVLVLATQALPAPYTVIANVQRHVVSSGGNTIHFPAQVTVHCPNYFGLRCHHQVNGHQVIINVFHGNPNDEGNRVIKSVIITRDGRVETPQDSEPQLPTDTKKHGTEGVASQEDSAINDVSSGESFNGKGEEEELDYRKYEKSVEVTTEKESRYDFYESFFGSPSKKSRDEDSEESQTEDNWPRNDEETETEKPRSEEIWDLRKKNSVEEDKTDLSPEVKTVSDYETYLEKDNSKEKSQNNDDDKTTEPNDTSNEKQTSNEVSKEDSEGDESKADRFTYDEGTTHASNSVEVTTSNALLKGQWTNLFWN